MDADQHDEDYMEALRSLPPPSKFALEWPDYQYQPDRPFSAYIPAAAKVQLCQLMAA